MRRSFGANRRHGGLSEDMVLQITSMADVFMILLVFLLKTYSTGVSGITPPQGMRLPTSVKPEKIVEALKVEISESWVRLDGIPVITMDKYKFKAEDMDANGATKSLKEGFSKFMENRSINARNEVLV